MPKRFSKLIPPSLYEMHELQRAGFVKLVLEGLATGAVSGFVIGLFRISYSFVNSTLGALFVKHSSTPAGIAGTVCFLLLCMIAAWLCLRHEPLISGSGIPHVELVLRGRLPMPWFRVLWTKFFGTLASLSGGLAVGREGPCIQMGAAIGCGVGRAWHDDHLRPRFLVGGSTAGMAAAFGAPLAGMFFAFEELRTIVTIPMLLFTSLAALGAWFMVDVVLQLGLVFPLAGTCLRIQLLWLAPLAGTACGLLAIFYNRLLVWLALAMDRTGMRQPWRMLLSFILAGVLLYLYPAAMAGLGPGICDLASGMYPLRFLLLLWGVKIAFNCISFSSGVSGGILMPMLLAGGLTGALLSAMLSALGCPGNYAAHLVILCMGSLFAGTVRAPLTGAFLITEMTGAWAMLPAVAAASFIASVLANALKSAPVYDSLRTRQWRLYCKAHGLDPDAPAGQSGEELPIAGGRI